MIDSVYELVEQKTGLQLSGPVRLLTQLRHFGVYFSPVNLFYCFGNDDSLVAMVAEVSNTPWNERHCYVLWEGNRLPQSTTRYSHPKEFHVSPFMGMDSQYDWRIQTPKQKLHLSLGCSRERSRIFQADLHLTRSELSDAQLVRTMLRRPVAAAHVVGAIYYQALRLWMKKCQFFPHPRNLEPQESTVPLPTHKSPAGHRGKVTTLKQRLTTVAFRKAVFAGLRQLVGGRITIVDGDMECAFGDPAADLAATIQVLDARFYRAIAIGGSMGAGESFRDGYWSCDDLVGLIRIFARNMQASEDLGGYWNSVLDLGRKVYHRMNRNTRLGSRRNIAAHYDLSNDFYSLFLDETMTYSSGVFPDENSSMREASIEKYDRICRKLRLTPGDEVLEIGTGWGGFAVHAVKNYGCRVTTTTISRQQHDYAKQRFASSGIGDRVTLLLSDYRDLSGQFDKLVSIEMIEAVGHEYFDTFFAKCSSSAEARRVVRAASDHDSRSALRTIPKVSRLHPAIHLSRWLFALAWRDDPVGW